MPTRRTPWSHGVSASLEPSALAARPTVPSVGRAVTSASEERRRDRVRCPRVVRRGVTGSRRRSSLRPSLLDQRLVCAESAGSYGPTRRFARTPGGCGVSASLEPSALAARPTARPFVGRAVTSASEERRRDRVRCPRAVRHGLPGRRSSSDERQRGASPRPGEWRARRTSWTHGVSASLKPSALAARPTTVPSLLDRRRAPSLLDQREPGVKVEHVLVSAACLTPTCAPAPTTAT